MKVCDVWYVLRNVNTIEIDCVYEGLLKECTIHLTKTTAVQNKVALSNHRVGGLYFLAVIFVATSV